MIDFEFSKKVVIILSASATVMSVGVYFGVLNYNIDRYIQEIEKLQVEVAGLQAGSQSKIEKDSYQDKEIERIYKRFVRIESVVFEPKTTKTSQF